MELDCDICSEQFDLESKRPKNLACGHMICLACIKEWAKDGHSVCPHDGKTFDEEPDNLPDNVYVMRLIGGEKQHKRKWWCLTCDQEADQTCEEEHHVLSLRKRRLQNAPALQYLKEASELLQRLLERLATFGQQLSSSVKIETHSQTGAELCESMRLVLEAANKALENTSSAWSSAVQAVDRELVRVQPSQAVWQDQLTLLNDPVTCQLQVRSASCFWEGEVDVPGAAAQVTEVLRYLLFLLRESGSLCIKEPAQQEQEPEGVEELQQPEEEKQPEPPVTLPLKEPPEDGCPPAKRSRHSSPNAEKIINVELNSDSDDSFDAFDTYFGDKSLAMKAAILQSSQKVLKLHNVRFDFDKDWSNQLLRKYFHELEELSMFSPCREQLQLALLMPKLQRLTAMQASDKPAQGETVQFGAAQYGSDLRVLVTDIAPDGYLLPLLKACRTTLHELHLVVDVSRGESNSCWPAGWRGVEQGLKKCKVLGLVAVRLAREDCPGGPVCTAQLLSLRRSLPEVPSISCSGKACGPGAQGVPILPTVSSSYLTWSKHSRA